MAVYNGISLIDDLDKTILATNAVDYGLDKLNDLIDRSLNIYNSQVADMFSNFCENTFKQTIAFDVSDNLIMKEVDQLARTTTEKNKRKIYSSFECRKYNLGQGYDVAWLNRASVAELSRKFKSFQIAHQRTVMREIKRRLYTSASSVFSGDYDYGRSLNIYGAWSADILPPQDVVSGSSFLSSHQHYNGFASGSLQGSDIDDMITHLVHHSENDDIIVVIDPANYDAVSAFTKFEPLHGNLIVPSAAADYTVASTSGREPNQDKMIGTWAGIYPVFYKPFSVANYLLAVNIGSQIKPLGFRESDIAQERGLKLNMAQSGQLIVDSAEAAFGLGGLNRSSWSICYAGNATWADPTIS